MELNGRSINDYLLDLEYYLQHKSKEQKDVKLEYIYRNLMYIIPGIPTVKE